MKKDIIDFTVWYSGAEKEKVEKAYTKYLRETKETSRLSPDNFEFFNTVVSFFDEKFFSEKAWLDCYDKLIRIDKFTEEQILYVVTYFRNEDNWWRTSGNFETLLKLRRTNAEKIKYIDFFIAKIKANYAANKKGFATGNIIHKDDGKKRNY